MIHFGCSRSVLVYIKHLIRIIFITVIFVGVVYYYIISTKWQRKQLIVVEYKDKGDRKPYVAPSKLIDLDYGESGEEGLDKDVSYSYRKIKSSRMAKLMKKYNVSGINWETSDTTPMIIS